MNEIGQIKRFTMADYKQCNAPGVVLVTSAWEEQGYVVKPFEEKKFKNDLFVSRNETNYRVEAERRTREARKPVNTYVQFDRLIFPYPTLHALQRKQVDAWDFYCQCFDCYDFDTKQQTFAIGTMHSSALKQMTIRSMNCYRNDEQITNQEQMGEVPLKHTIWVVFQNNSWVQKQATTTGYRQAEDKFLAAGLTWENLI